MASTNKNIFHNIAIEASPIDLVLTPEFIQVQSGSIVTFSTTGTVSSDGSSVIITWELLSPVGSIQTLTISNDTSEARLTPDVNGIYKINIEATNDSNGIATLSSYIIVTSSDIQLNRDKPSSDFIGESISSFWKLIENKNVLKSLWSEYINLLSSDYKKAAELVLSKSIQNIQEGRLVSNIVIEPQLYLDNYSHTFKILPPYVGTATCNFSINPIIFSTIILSPTSIKFVYTGNSVLSVIKTGSELEIYGTSSVAGKYTILSVDDAFVQLSSKTPIVGTTEVSTALISTSIGSNIISLTNITGTISVGDILIYKARIYKILDDSSTDSSLSASEYKVDFVFVVQNVAQPVKIHTTAPASLHLTDEGLTNVMYVPAAELGGKDRYYKIYSNISILFTDPNKFILGAEQKLLYAGTSVTLLQEKAGSVHTVVSKSYNNITGAFVYTVEPPLPTSLFEVSSVITIKCKVESNRSLVGGLIRSGNITGEIKSIDYLVDHYNTSYAVIKTHNAQFLSGLTGLNWRVCSTIETTSLMHTINYAEEGVAYGDTLRLEITSSLSASRSFIDCTVVGVLGNKISFEPTLKELVNSVEPVYDEHGITTDPLIGDLLSASFDSELVGDILNQLRIPEIRKNSSNKYIFKNVAKNIHDAVETSLVRAKYSTIKSSTFSTSNSTPETTIYITETSLLLSIARASIKPVFILRNSSIPMLTTSDVVSIPSLTEFVYPKQTSTIEASSNIAILHEDGYVSIRNKPEEVLTENIHFYVTNGLSFSVTDLTKTEGMVVTSNSFFLVDRNVEEGDLLVIDSIEYIIKKVLNNTTLEILTTSFTSSFESLVFSKKQGTITKSNTKECSYVKFRPGVFSPSNPAPKKLVAQSIILDNSKQIEANFGVLAGYTLNDFYSFSSPQISYLNAIKCLMYAWSYGPTIYSIKLATAVLLNLPVTQKKSTIVDIDTTEGVILLQPLTEDGDDEGPVESYLYSTAETIHPFSSMSMNKVTGLQYTVGDVIPAFTPITNKAYVVDYTLQPFSFLEEFHSWKVLLDANAINTRDIPILAKYYDLGRPIHTKLDIQVILYLVSTVKILIRFTQEGQIYLVDDPGFSLELNHAFDSSNNSGQILRLTGVGEFSTRTLFKGNDLVFTSSAAASSTRGGFELDGSSYFTDDPGQGVQNDVKELGANDPFSGIHFVRGKNLVRQGDILMVYSGVNEGIYNIDSVVSDTEINVSALTGYGIYTKTPQQALTEKASFAVLRKVTDIIVSDLTITNSSSNTITVSGSSLNWDGVTVGDVLVKSSDHTIKYTIVDVPYDPITEDAAIQLILDNPVSAGSDLYFIYRPALIPQKSNQGSITSYDSNDPRLINHNLTDAYKIQVGDQFVLTSGTPTEIYSVVTLLRNGSFYIADDLGVAENDTFEIRKLGRPLEDNSDKRLELLHGYDDLSITLRSATASVSVVSESTNPSGVVVAELVNIDANSGDIIKLYLANNTIVFEGTVSHKLSSTSCECFVITNTVNNPASGYFVEITKRFKS